ncbi:MAG: type II secretion system minor pseudopilin GspI [Serratia sp. (in: enterobacteria)]|uniref:type II secretion system minor pseudopilin GspI n=1 Tax=Serratia sp. (in: enterobacteria) TaxID=616 RepID=UPI003F361007
MRSKTQRGMTLLEVLVALVVFAIGCMAVARTTGQQIRSLSELDKKILAGWVADNQLALVTLGGVRPSPLWQQGSESMGDRDWFWRYRSLQTTNPQLYAVDIEVTDDPAFTRSTVQVRTWMK